MRVLSYFIKYGDFKYIWRQGFDILLSINRILALLLAMKSTMQSLSH